MTIDLSQASPRQYQHIIEAALTKAGYVAVAEALHNARPRDIAEVFVLLPEDVEIKIGEASGHAGT